MALSSVPVGSLTEEHLQSLIDDSVSEGREIEYKAAVGKRDEDKREFLADVSSFANAVGGDLLIGVGETSGNPSALDGVAKAGIDAEVLRLENAIRDGIEPRIPGIAVRPVPLTSKQASVLVIRVPRSWAAPHMVTFRGHSRFYSRNSAGKYPLDVSEIRAAFVASEGARTQLRAFRLERLGRIVANDGPVRLRDDPKTVLHVIPVTAIDPSMRYDVTRLADYTSGNFMPLTGRAWNNRINFDGVVAWAPGNEQGDQSYTQVFHSGAIEGAEGFMLRREYLDKEHLIPSTDFEASLIAALGRYLGLIREIGAPPPYVVALSLLDVRGLRMGVGERYFQSDVSPIDRDDLVIPEVVIEDLAAAPHTVLRPLLDAVWNAVGWRGSPNYTEDGAWEPGRRG